MENTTCVDDGIKTAGSWLTYTGKVPLALRRCLTAGLPNQYSIFAIGSDHKALSGKRFQLLYLIYTIPANISIVNR
jgi:hypothetical protein